MTAYDNAQPVARDDGEQTSVAHDTANPAATRAAQAFASSTQMKVLAEIERARAAKRASR